MSDSRQLNALVVSILRTGLMLSCLSQIASVAAAVTPALTTSRTSGVAPLGVFFDATGTSVSDSSLNAFRDLGYRFDFGDPTSGTWQQTGKSKNEQIGGPIAAHVYKNPGVYSAKVDVFSPNGGMVTTSVTITVQSADEAFPATSTVCIAMQAADAGCPTGASKRIAPTTWGTFASNTRYLLAAGQDFSILGKAWLTCTNCQLSSYGAGAKPKVKAFSINENPTAIQRKDISVFGLTTEIASVPFGENVLLLENEIYPVQAGSTNIAVGTSVEYYFGNPGSLDPKTIKWPKYIFLVDNNIDAKRLSQYGIFGLISHFAIIGNSLRNPAFHDIRFPLSYKGFIAHNLLGNIPDATYHQIKLHSRGLDTLTNGFVYEAPKPASAYSIISQNIVGEDPGGLNNWQLVTSPQNSTSAEGVKDIIIEDNKFVKNPSAPAYQFQIEMVASGVVERGNSYMQGSDSIKIAESTHPLLPPEWLGPNYLRLPSISSWIGTAANDTSMSPAPPLGLQVD